MSVGPSNIPDGFVVRDECPHCGEPLCMLAEEAIANESGDFATSKECPGCGAEVWISVEVVYETTIAVRKENK